jgi:hypothetical protein
MVEDNFKEWCGSKNGKYNWKDDACKISKESYHATLRIEQMRNTEQRIAQKRIHDSLTRPL